MSASAEPSLWDKSKSKSRIGHVHPVFAQLTTTTISAYRLVCVSAGTRVGRWGCQEPVVLADVMLAAARINVARGTQQPSRSIMEAWPAGPLPRGLRSGIFLLLLWLGSRTLGGRGEMAVSPPWRYLGTLAVAVVQDQDALRLSIHSSLNLLPGQATPPTELKFTLCLSETAMLASGSWHRTHKASCRCRHHVRTLKPLQR